MTIQNLDLPTYLFWDMDTSRLDVDRSYKLVIERVIQLGTLPQWKETQRYFGAEKFLEVAAWSKQLSPKEIRFTELFTKSTYHGNRA